MIAGVSGAPESPDRAGGGTVRADWVRSVSVPTPFPVGPVNVHILTKEPVTLVDSGPLTGVAWDALVEGLRGVGLSPRDVQRVLLTHGHHDHYGLAARVADVSNARLYGGKLDRCHFQMKNNAKLLLDELARADFGVGPRFVVVSSVAAVDRFAEPLAAWDDLAGGEVLPGDGYRVVVRSTPGHTPGSLTFEIPEAGLLFTGDTVLKDITPNAVVDVDPENPEKPFRSVTRYFESLREIAKTSGGSRLLTGHGSPIPDYAAHYEKVSRRYALRIQQIERVLARGPKTVRELVTSVFPRVRTLNIFLAYSEIMGFLMYLEDLGRVEKIVGALRDRYRLAIT